MTECIPDPRAIATVCMTYPGPSLAEQIAHWVWAGVGVVLVVVLLLVLFASNHPGGRQ